MEYTHFNEIADTAKFIAVYPNGIDDAWDTNNDERELGFMKALIDYMVQTYPVDMNRIYMAGSSWGGVIVCHAMNKMANTIAAFGLNNAHTYLTRKPASCRPIPIISVRGLLDPIMNPLFNMAEMKRWAKYDGLSTTPIQTNPYFAKNTYLSRFTGGEDGIEIWLYTLKLGTHKWYHDDDYLLTACEFWNFFKKYSLNGLVPTGIDVVNTQVKTSATTRKELREGKLIIRKNNKVYNAAGVEVSE